MLTFLLSKVPSLLACPNELLIIILVLVSKGVRCFYTGAFSAFLVPYIIHCPSLFSDIKPGILIALIALFLFIKSKLIGWVDTRIAPFVGLWLAYFFYIVGLLVDTLSQQFMLNLVL